MAKKKRRKNTKQKKFEYTEELTGLILLILSILSIPPIPLGFVGEIVASFAMFLVGTAYQILLLLTLILGLYLIIKRSWPNFFTTKLVGFYFLCLGFLVLSHISYVTENSGDVLIVVKDTIDNLLANFSNTMKAIPLTLKGAGVIGAVLSILFYKLFATQGTYIVAGLFIFVGTILLTGFNPVEKIKEFLEEHKLKKKDAKLSNTMANVKVNDSTKDEIEQVEKSIENSENKDDNKIKIHNISELTKINNYQQEEKTEEYQEVKDEIPQINYQYRLPSLSLISPVTL